MASRLLIFLFVAFVALSVEAFAPTTPTFAVSSSTSLQACRVNAKKEKIKRNRENMRKFTTGRKGVSRRKILKKTQASQQRQIEAEFIAKCFTTIPVPGSDDQEKK